MIGRFASDMSWSRYCFFVKFSFGRSFSWNHEVWLLELCQILCVELVLGQWVTISSPPLKWLSPTKKGIRIGDVRYKVLVPFGLETQKQNFPLCLTTPRLTISVGCYATARSSYRIICKTTVAVQTIKMQATPKLSWTSWYVFVFLRIWLDNSDYI